VGALTFDATAISTATLTYTVDGTQVVKTVTRQLWRYENVAGNYYGGFVWDQTGCKDPDDNDHYEVFGAMAVSHAADNTVRMTLQIDTITNNGAPQPLPPGATGTISGPYTQSGHMGQIAGTFTFVIGPDTGTMSWNLFEIERSINGITGRFNATAQGVDQCAYNGRFGGVRR
jgi:hypothetical protein